MCGETSCVISWLLPFVLSNSSVLVLFYLIINLDGRGGGEELGRIEAGETRIHYERKKLFSIEKKPQRSQTNNVMMHLRALVEEAAARFQMSSKLKLCTTNVYWHQIMSNMQKQSIKRIAVFNNSTSFKCL